MSDLSKVTDMAVLFSVVTRRLHFVALVSAYNCTGSSETTTWSVSHGLVMLNVVGKNVVMGILDHALSWFTVFVFETERMSVMRLSATLVSDGVANFLEPESVFLGDEGEFDVRIVLVLLTDDVKGRLVDARKDSLFRKGFPPLSWDDLKVSLVVWV